MNAEIYFPRTGKAFGQTAEKSFETTVKKLSDLRVDIIYKTEIDLTANSVAEALRVSQSGDEKIGMIFIADAMPTDSLSDAKKLFEEMGIYGKVKRIETDCRDPLDESQEQTSTGTEKKKKKKKKKNKSSKEQSAAPEEGELIDISHFEVSIEKKKVYAFTAEFNNTTVVLLPPHEVLNAGFYEVLFSAARKLVMPRKKIPFWKRFIPCKGDRPFDVIRKIILILAIGTFVVSSCMLVNILVVEPQVRDKVHEEIKKLHDTAPATDLGEKKPTDGSKGVLSDFTKLLNVNPDTVGWITVPNTVIDYVVLQAEGDAQRVANGEDPYYLFRDFYKNDTKYGAVFMDYRSQLDGKNIILHGHHMHDGRMFTRLTEYDNIDFYKNAPVITFDTLYERSKWKVFAVMKTNTQEWQGPVFNYLRGRFSSDYDFLNYIYQVRVRSILNIPVDVNENDTILTLSTCCYDFDDFRFVVYARKLREGEDKEVDLSKVEYNPVTLYPDICHNYWGVPRPDEVTSFQDAYNKGKIVWYDGTGKWSQKDDDDLTKLLRDGKANAEKMLRASYNKKDYAEEQLKEIDAIIESYMEQINKAEKGTEVNELYATALAEIENVKTKKQIKEDEEAARKQAEEDKKKEISEAKTEAVAALNSSIAGREYRTKQYDQVIKLLDNYTKRINNSSDLEQIENLKEQGIEALTKVATNDELSEREASRRAEEEASRRAEEEASRRAAEESSREEEESSREEEESSQSEDAEMEAYRQEAIVRLQSYLNPSDFSEATAARLQELIDEYTGYLSVADTREAVDGKLREGESQLEAVASAEEQSQQSTEESQPDESSEISVETSAEEETSEEDTDD